MKKLTLATIIALFSLTSTTAMAGDADVENINISSLGNGKFRVNVTIRHTDSGWDHYANQWDVLDETGKVIGTRILHHPHVNEQPFTRSLTLEIPKAVQHITVKAHDLVHKTGGNPLMAKVPHE